MSTNVDGDLLFSEAMMAELRTCSVGGGDFHLGRFLVRVAVTEGHDTLIAEWETRLESMYMDHHKTLAEEVIQSLKRKKAEAGRKSVGAVQSG